jgi:hypothetical protein
MDESEESQAITFSAKTADLTHSYGGNEGMMSKRFSLIDITQMHFHHRHGYGS